MPVPDRTRYLYLWLAVCVLSISRIIDPIILVAGNDYVTESWPVLVQLASVIFGAILFAYVILRHRVVDLGFAINRALVFSSLSFVLLLTFGTVEWASEKLLPFESHEVGVAINMAVALSLFMIFHRIHERVERSVERVFFHKWRLNTEALSRFIQQAAYIMKPDTLMERLIAELARFSGQPDVALYRREGSGYILKAGEHPQLPPHLDADMPVLVAMRAERTLIRDAFLPGALLLPMMHRADVTSFVVVRAKPNGEPYRPDEEEELAAAVRQVGLDFYALRVEELEGEVALFTARIAAVAC